MGSFSLVQEIGKQQLMFVVNSFRNRVTTRWMTKEGQLKYGRFKIKNLIVLKEN